MIYSFIIKHIPIFQDVIWRTQQKGILSYRCLDLAIFIDLATLRDLIEGINIENNRVARKQKPIIKAHSETMFDF